MIWTGKRKVSWRKIYHIYYIDNSVLVENIPLIKFIRNYIQDSSGVFSISSLVRISLTPFPAFTLSFVQRDSCLYNKKKIHIFAPWCNIPFIWHLITSFLFECHKWEKTQPRSPIVSCTVLGFFTFLELHVSLPTWCLAGFLTFLCTSVLLFNS